MSWFVIIFLSLPVWADQIDDQLTDTIVKRDLDTKVENDISENEEFKKCQDQHQDDQQKVRECFQEKLNQLSEDEIEELSKKINLKSYDIKSSKTTKSVRQYLQERLSNLTRGKREKEADEFSLKGQKYVAHDKYYELYKTQLSKNVLLEVSEYCLENLRVKSGSKNELIKPIISYSSKADEKERLSDFYQVLIKNAKEIKSEDTKAEDLKKLSQDELKKSADYLKGKYQACLKAVPIMCQIYQCRNVISSKESIDGKRCTELFGGTTWLGSKNAKGKIACTVTETLAQYRKAIKKNEEIKKEFVAAQNKKGGYNVAQGGFDGEYSGSNQGGDKSIDEVTSISSRELTDEDNVTTFAELEDEAKRLQDECKTEDFDSMSEECKAYFVTEDKLSETETKFNSRTEIELKKIENLKDKPDELTQYLKENGLDQYLQEDGSIDPSLTPEQIVQSVREKYQGQRKAVIERLKAEYESKKMLKENVTAEDVAKKVDSTAEEIKDKKQRIENLLHYNNIVTSLLELEDQSGEKSSNTTAFRIEKESISGAEDEEEYQYLQNLNIEDNNNSGSVSISDENLKEIIGNKSYSNEPNQDPTN